VLSLRQQVQLLSVCRSGLYYKPRPADDQEVRLKHRLDELYTERPFLGSRKIVRLLAQEGLPVGRHTVRRYRAEMGLETLYAKPRLSAPAAAMEHRVYPYLLRDLAIERPNRVWGIDITYITYIRLQGGWMYLDVSGCYPGLVQSAGGGLGTLGQSGDGVRPGLRRGGTG